MKKHSKHIADLFVVFDYALAVLFSFLCFVSLLSNNFLYTILFGVIAFLMSPITDDYFKKKKIRNPRIFKLVIVVLLLIVFAFHASITMEEELSLKRGHSEINALNIPNQPVSDDMPPEVVDITVS